MSVNHPKTYGGHVGPRESTRLLVTTLSSMIFLHYPELAISLAGPATWQLVLLLLPPGLAFAWLVSRLAYRFPGKSLHQMAESAAGRLLGSLLMLLVLVWLLGHLTLNLRDFTETFKITLLPETPVSVISLLLMASAGAACWAGLEAIARVSQIFFVPIYLILALVFLLNLPMVDLAQYFPIWGYGWRQTVLGALRFLPMLSELVVILILGQAFRSPRQMHQASQKTVILYNLIGLAMALMMVGVFGSPGAQRIPFALLALARVISIGRWVERVEALVVSYWVLAACIRLSLLLYAATLQLAALFRIPNHRPLILPLIVIVGSLSLVPKDFASVLRMDRVWMQIAGSVTLAIPLLILALAVVRKKGGRPRES